MEIEIGLTDVSLRDVSLRSSLSSKFGQYTANGLYDRKISRCHWVLNNISSRETIYLKESKDLDTRQNKEYDKIIIGEWPILFYYI